MQKGKPHITTYNSPIPSEVLYRFGADGNLRMYSYDRLFYSLYGYDGGTTRTYKYSFDLNPNWVNGRLEAVNFNLHNAMFYPNAYINFNNNGYYTKHYYNGTERIASRLGDQNLPINVNDPELQDRKDWQDSLIRKNVTEITGYDFLPVGEEQNPEDPKPVFELPQVGITNLIQNTSSIYYYHTNHLGSTCYVTDGNASVVQGFLYAPFGEITNEHNSSFGNGVIPKYSFNAKELDEETGMYYYEARYYAPPVFISRDPLFEKYPTFSPYAYCANNPVKFIDPDGRDIVITGEDGSDVIYKQNMNSEGYDGFIKHAIETLNYIYSTDEGKNMIDHLCDHGNSVFIEKMGGGSSYRADIPENITSEVLFDETNNKPGTGKGFDFQIFWDIDNPVEIPVLDKSVVKNAAYDLLHEICHAYDFFSGYGTNAKFEYDGEQYEKAEYQAMYRANVVIYQMGDMNFRSSYDGTSTEPQSAIRYKKKNTIVRPSWNYPKCKGDDNSIILW